MWSIGCPLIGLCHTSRTVIPPLNRPRGHLHEKDGDVSVDEQSVEWTAPASEPERPSSRTINGVIGLLLVATFVMILNETIMTLAIARLITVLDITASTAQWLTTAFLLTMAVVIPTTGFVLQRFSTRSVFMAAMSLFTAGTLLAAVAPGFPVLLIGRVVQASGTAVMLPLLITTVLTFIPEERRGTMMGLISIVIGVAPAIGPTISGLILEHFSWRWLFIVMLPIAAISLGLGATLIRNITTPRKAPFDLPSVALSAVAFAGLVYGLNLIGESAVGHTPIPPFVPIGIGAAGLAVFVWRQVTLQRHGAALLDLRPFRTRAFTVGVIVLLVAMAALFGALILLPLYLQNVWALTPLEAGIVMLPGGLAMGLIAPVTGAAYDRLGPRPLVVPGAVILAVAMVLFTTLDASAPTSDFLWFTNQEWKAIGIHVLLSLGLGILMTPLMASALGSVPAHLYSHASAIQNTLQQLAGAAGTALFITVMTRSVTTAVERGADEVIAQSDGIVDAYWWGAGLAALAVILSTLVRRSSGGADAASPEASAPVVVH
jgi:DHA2 family lincomycin resistance protein-like MFS transporter